MNHYFYLLSFLVFIHLNSFGQIDLENGLVAYFPMDGNTNDESILGLNGQANNVQLTNGIGGITNTAYLFNGVNSYINCGTNHRNISDIAVVSFWCKTTATAYQHMVCKYDWTVDRGFFVGIVNGNVKLDGRNNSGSYTATLSESIINDGQWHHIITAIHGNVWKIWIDCVLEATSISYSQNPNLSNDEPLTIGNYYMGGANGDHVEFSGSIDNVRIYNRELSDAEMRSLCDIHLSVPEVVNNDFKIDVYPVPADDFVTIQTDGINVDQIEMFDINGGQVLSSKMQATLNGSTLLPGFYFLKLINGNAVYTKKIVVE